MATAKDYTTSTDHYHWHPASHHRLYVLWTMQWNSLALSMLRLPLV